MGRKVILLANRCDGTREKLQARLSALGVVTFHIDPDHFPSETTASVRNATASLTGSFGTLRLEDAGAVWVGLGGTPAAVRAQPTPESEAARRVWEEAWSGAPALWVNDPARAAACTKLRQLELAREAGFRTPRTLLTNDPDAALRFHDACPGEVVFKALEPSFWDSPHALFAAKVPRRRIAAAGALLTRCPAQLQEYIPKRFELRVTVVGRRVFTAALHSQLSPRGRVDWRRDIDRIRYEAFDLPDAVAGQLLRMMSRAGLVYGAADLILTPDGEYVFLEVNAQGQFGWIEERTGLPLYAALAELLAEGAR